MKSLIRKKCLCCNNKNLKEIINLGSHSFADRFIPKSKLKFNDPQYPLILDLCDKCKYVQSRHITSPKNRYVSIDYSYTSSNSNYSKNHWIDFASSLEKKTKLQNKKIIEIGSNDGFLSYQLKKKGAQVLGVDASEFMVKLSKKKINAIQSIFTLKESRKIKKLFGEADIIIANNVFNHSDKPLDFLDGVKNLLKKDAIFIFEQPNFTKGVLDLKFDQIYHEHISYFTVRNIKSLLKCSDLKIISVKKNGYHGGSLRTIATNSYSKLKEFNTNKLIKFENKNKIYSVKFYKNMMKKINIKKNNLLNKLIKLTQDGYIISGIGAGAKSNTFLTFYGLNNIIIKFLTDSSKFKKNKYTPITRIIIKDDNELTNYKKIACLILSWNISRIVIKKIKKINKNIKFIKT
jgi:2-polyprenyl-3-methyl-5-hydroxy-6-metoxy-1,4-benzoquinol methylase